MHLLHVKETHSNRTMTMETDISFFKIDFVLISKNTEAESNIDIYAEMKLEFMCSINRDPFLNI